MHDILLDRTGDIAIIKGDISIVESLRQAVAIKLRWFLGEWIFNPELGVPYYEEIFGKGIDLKRVEAIIEEAILDVDGIESVSSVTASYSRTSRSLSVMFVATGNGEILKEEVTIIV